MAKKDSSAAPKNSRASKTTKTRLPAAVFEIAWKPTLVHQTAVGLLANKRRPVAHAKDRSQVRGGGRKPWRQKGTGRARHGSIRSPLWSGGGATFGPEKERSFKKKVSKKAQRSAFLSLISRKNQEGHIRLIKTLPVKEGKTREVAQFLAHQVNIKGKSALFIVSHKEFAPLARAVRNLPRHHAVEAGKVNVLHLLQYFHVFLTQPGLTELLARFTSSAPKTEAGATKSAHL